MAPKYSVLLFCFVSSLTLLMTSCNEQRFQRITSQEWTEITSSNGKLLVVFSKDTGCPTCEDTVNLIASLVGDPDLDSDMIVGHSSDVDLASTVGIMSYPAIVFLREKSHAIFDEETPDIENLAEWLELSRSKVTHELHDDSFEHLTQASTGATTGDWLVAFYQERCVGVLPLMESVGVRIRQKTNVAIVDSSKNMLLAKRFSIQHCPEIILFKQGKMYRYEVPKLDQMSLKSFVNSWHVNSKAEIVLPPKSRFDDLTEFIAHNLKTQLEGENRLYVIGAMCGAIGFFLIAFTVCCCCCGSGQDKKKMD